MSAAPIVITSEALSQREARPIVLVCPEEILKMRTESFAKNKSEIGFLIRQPSAAAIMSSYVELELVLKFKTTRPMAQPIQRGTLANGQGPGGGGMSGMMPEGLPIQSKCVRTAVLSINGASQTYRCSEFVSEYLKLHASRAYMERIGYGWNENLDGNNYNSTYLRQQDAWRKQLTVNNRIAHASDADADGTHHWTKSMVFREPLVIGPFGALNHMDAYPAWSCEGAKSPSLLHCDQMQLSFSMLDHWAQNLFLIIQGSDANTHPVGGEVVDLEVVGAFINTTFYTPPPKMISSSLSQAVRYATWSALRFKMQDPTGAGANGVLDAGEPCKFNLRAATFPYMPNLWVFSVQPNYETKSGRFSGNGANTDEWWARQCKSDKRLTIYQMRLQINATSDAMPFKGGGGVDTAANSVLVQLNSRELYRYYLKNSSSWESAIYSYEEWFNGGCIVAFTSEDLNGITNSPSIRGQVTISGEIFCQNNMNYAVCIADARQPGAIVPNTHDSGGGGNGNATSGFALDRLEHFSACIIGIYTNKQITVDAKSAMLSEAVFSEQLGEQLRLSNAAQ